jgi:methylenetetrahydrofolate reductase (NADPH)
MIKENFSNRIEELLTVKKDIKFSFEFFPPKNDEMNIKLWDTITKLKNLNPEFISVTYGAGGSTRARTHETISKIISNTSLVPASHLTCIGSSKDEINEILRNYWKIGVKHIVALRGDMPLNLINSNNSTNLNSYKYASELVYAIKSLKSDNINFRISVAGYPEKHPEAKNISQDIDNLKRKVDAGADQIITQFFFDCDVFFRFKDMCLANNINIPIIPGILPVTNFVQVKKFADMCQAKIPDWMTNIFNNLDNNIESRNIIAAMISIEQCRLLMQEDIKNFHFYTLNRAELTQAICSILN